VRRETSGHILHVRVAQANVTARLCTVADIQEHMGKIVYATARSRPNGANSSIECTACGLE
jgi:hypothetical protein